MTEVVRYASGEAAVLNQGDPSGLVLDLPPSNAQRRGGQIEWSPKDGRALDLEVRARLVDADIANGEAPLVRWYAEVSQGQHVHRVPARPATPPAVALPFTENVMPDRGLVARINARNLRVVFINYGQLGGAAAGAMKLVVSIQPVQGMHLPAFVRSQLYTTGPAAVFPADATQWRVRDLLGRPFVLGAAAVQFTGIKGFPSGPVDAVDLADWTPIPAIAALWTCSEPALAEYR